MKRKFSRTCFTVASTCLEGGGFDPLWSSNGWGIWTSELATQRGIDQFRYIKIQPQTIDLSTRLWGINTEFVGFIPQSLVLKSIVWDWILIYRNWSIWPKFFKKSNAPGFAWEGEHGRFWNWPVHSVTFLWLILHKKFVAWVEIFPPTPADWVASDACAVVFQLCLCHFCECRIVQWRHDSRHFFLLNCWFSVSRHSK